MHSVETILGILKFYLFWASTMQYDISWWFWAAAVSWAPGPPWDHDGKQPAHLHSFCAHIVPLLLFTFSVSVLSHCSHVWLFATLWTEAHQAPLSMKFSRQDYGSGLPCPPPGHLPHPGVEPESVTLPALAGQILYHECHLGAPLSVQFSSVTQ